MSKPPEHQRRALGKGLSALLQPRYTHEPAPKSPAVHKAGVISHLEIDRIDPNPVQPRRTFEPALLEELAQSIRSNGIIQPLVVRQHGDRYQLVAGERRWRAARLAGLAEVPAVVESVPDDRLLEITLIENIQREDLNPIEVAEAFQRLIAELGLSHEELARRTGKDRTTITNTLRLLRLPVEVQQLVAERRLSMGHARAILGLPSQDLQTELAHKAAAQGLSVRQVERMVNRMTEDRSPTALPGSQPEDSNVKAAIGELERFLGTRVRIVDRGGNRGRIEIEYYSMEDLQRIYSQILGEEARTA